MDDTPEKIWVRNFGMRRPWNHDDVMGGTAYIREDIHLESMSKAMSMADISDEYISKILHAAPFATNEVGIPEMCELIRSLQTENERLRVALYDDSGPDLLAAQQRIKARRDSVGKLSKLTRYE